MQNRDEYFADNYGGPEEDGEILRTVVIITERLEEGELLLAKRVTASSLYTSDYWKSQPNGEHEVLIHHKGIRNREIPKPEKAGFAEFILPYCTNGQALASICRVQNEDGTVWQVQIEEKI